MTYSEINNLYSITIVLLGWFLLRHILLLRPCPWIELFHHALKCSKLTQLDVQVQYHMNIIYILRGGYTCILWEKKIMSLSQVYAWLKNNCSLTIQDFAILLDFCYKLSCKLVNYTITLTN